MVEERKIGFLIKKGWGEAVYHHSQNEQSALNPF